MHKTHSAIALILFAATASAAQAQTYGGAYGRQPPPLYPYAVQQPYAVEVAPNTYVIRRPATTRNYLYITCANCYRNSSNAAPDSSAPAFDRPQRAADRGLIEELRARNAAREIATQPAKQTPKQTVITTKKVLREKPVVHETVRVVDDPPRVIERKHVIVDVPTSPKHAQAAVGRDKGGALADGKVRVIRAEAEVTILGPDRMSIRLFRRGGEPEAKALPGE